jgi:RNA polymerase sigma-70 factor, ECF subfamily
MTAHDIDANQLMRDFQSGNEQAFESMYLLFMPSLYSFLFRFTRDEQLSIDLVQDTFEKLHRYGKKFDSKKASAKTYIFQISYNLMVDKIKKQKRLQRLLPYLVPQKKEQFAHEDRITIREAIMKLPETQRVVIILSYYHDMSHADISEILNIPVGTVKSRLFHSVKSLRKFLEVDDNEEQKTN